MKGDLPRSLRALSLRLSWGALAFSAFSLLFYAAADFRDYGEAALNLALRVSGIGAAVALCAALSAAALDLAAPFFKQPILIKTLLASVIATVLALTLLLASGALRAVFGGLSL